MFWGAGQRSTIVHEKAFALIGDYKKMFPVPCLSFASFCPNRLYRTIPKTVQVKNRYTVRISTHEYL